VPPTDTSNDTQSHRCATEAATGNGDSTSESDPRLVFLEELLEEHATIAGDVIEIDAHTRAIHGSIAVDGEVIVAEYDTAELARTVLDDLTTADGRADRR
jgi:hypothetical protein